MKKHITKLCLAIFCLLGLLPSSGCKIRMSPEEQLGLSEKQIIRTFTSEQEDQENASTAEYIKPELYESPFVTDENDASSAYGELQSIWNSAEDRETSAEARCADNRETDTTSVKAETESLEEIRLKRLITKYVPFREDGAYQVLFQLYGEEADKYHITCFDGGTGLIVSRYGNLDYADLMNTHLMANFQNPAGAIHMGDGAKLRKPQMDYFLFISKDTDKEITCSAENLVKRFLSGLGYDIASVDSTFLSADVLELLRTEKSSLYEGTGLTYENSGIQDWEEAGIFYFAARQNLGKVPVESFTGESLIEAAYSPVLDRIVLVKTSMPVYEDSYLNEKEVPLLEQAEAFLFADEILKTTVPGDYKITDAQLVYAHSKLGAYNYDEQSVSLWPAWKFSFRAFFENQEIDDYIMLDAETGQQLTNATPLY